MRINFLHLDLGLGGAERLVVDAACALKQRGHQVIIATSHHDPNRCFEETMPALNGLISKDIRCIGDELPRHCLGGRFHLLFAVLRMCVVSFFFANKDKPDVIFVDQVSFIVPLIRFLAPGVPILFYCHFPDKLLAPPSRSPLRRLYRFVFDFAEEVTTANADRIVVNSKFTASVVEKAFPYVASKHKLDVLYPCVDLKALDEAHGQSSQSMNNLFGSQPEVREIVKKLKYVLSINRFERKKGLDVAIKALALMRNKKSILIVTGGYDVRVLENVEHLEELKAVARDRKVADRVYFLPSCTQEEKQVLLEYCSVLVYTPQNEHFGIVPIEAGACSKPVVACNSGGPTESIVDQVTGTLVDPTPEAFAKALDVFIDERNGESESKRIGTNARKRVESMFARESFGQALESILIYMTYESSQKARNDASRFTNLLVMISAFLVLAMSLGYFMVAKVFVESHPNLFKMNNI